MSKATSSLLTDSHEMHCMTSLKHPDSSYFCTARSVKAEDAAIAAIIMLLPSACEVQKAICLLIREREREDKGKGSSR